MFLKTSQNSQKKTALESPFNPLTANPTKLSNTLKIFVRICQQTVWVCLSILYIWHLNLEPAILLEKRFWHVFCSVNFENFFLRTSFLLNTCWKMLMKGEFYKNWQTHFYYKEILWNLQLFQRADVAREGEFCKSHFIYIL